MQDHDQKKVFFKIAQASVKNMVGFGLATALIGYLATQTDIGALVKLLAIVVVFIMAVSINSLLMFIVYTVEGIPSTMANKLESVTFWDIYSYIMAALALRIVEAGLCVAYIVYLYNIFF